MGPDDDFLKAIVKLPEQVPGHVHVIVWISFTWPVVIGSSPLGHVRSAQSWPAHPSSQTHP